MRDRFFLDFVYPGLTHRGYRECRPCGAGASARWAEWTPKQLPVAVSVAGKSSKKSPDIPPQQSKSGIVGDPGIEHRDVRGIRSY